MNMFQSLQFVQGKKTSPFPLWKVVLIMSSLTLIIPGGATQASSLDRTKSPVLGDITSHGTATNGTVNARAYPWSTIGRLNIGGKAYCTAVMIGKKHLYTQADCLYNKAEKRWWKKDELHYRAGYQHDGHIASSNISRVEVSENFNPRTPDTLASIAGNWALITLTEPLGKYTGWLGIKGLNKTMRQNLKSGSAKMFNAGYHNGWEHAVRVSNGCSNNVSKQIIPGVGKVPCRELKMRQKPLPTLYYQNGSYQLVSSAVFSQSDSPRRNDSWVFASLKNAHKKWGSSHRP